MTPVPYPLSRATPAELDVLLALARQTFREAFTDQNDPAQLEHYLATAFTEAQFRQELANPASEFWLAWEEGQALGYLKVNFAPAQTELRDPASLEVERIYVLADYHGRGVAQVLLEKAVEIARENCLSSLWLGVWEHNHKALRFYRKHGFEVFSSHPFQFGNEVQTDLLMKRETGQERPAS